MNNATKNLLVESINAVCYAAVVIACCSVITLSWVLISAASVINII